MSKVEFVQSLERFQCIATNVSWDVSKEVVFVSVFVVVVGVAVLSPCLKNQIKSLSLLCGVGETSKGTVTCCCSVTGQRCLCLSPIPSFVVTWQVSVLRKCSVKQWWSWGRVYCVCSLSMRRQCPSTFMGTSRWVAVCEVFCRNVSSKS